MNCSLPLQNKNKELCSIFAKKNAPPKNKRGFNDCLPYEKSLYRTSHHLSNRANWLIITFS